MATDSQALKNAARTAITRAVKRGILSHPKTHRCENCGAPAEAYHHPDYHRPMDVVALCTKCHLGLKASGRRITG